MSLPIYSDGSDFFWTDAVISSALAPSVLGMGETGGGISSLFLLLPGSGLAVFLLLSRRLGLDCRLLEYRPRQPGVLLPQAVHLFLYCRGGAGKVLSVA
ncbi:MAG: hypothetical protein IJ615_10695, partial [Bacteroidaceae bacterium]|nr:hypothetical protein [Bacteroidaceae bacterium]